MKVMRDKQIQAGLTCSRRKAQHFAADRFIAALVGVLIL